MKVTPQDYQYFCAILEQKSGIELGEGREYLIESRLQPLMAEVGCQTLGDLVQFIKSNGDTCFIKALVDRMTTNESLFFRDATPFEVLKNRILPELHERKRSQKNLRIWSAGCSTGQEPYSVVMTLMMAQVNFLDWNVEVIATDLCSMVLSRAREGIFSQFEVNRGISEDLLKRFFRPCSAGWQIKPEIRDRVTFRELNLIEPFSPMGSFDLILCRNVLIYFSLDSKRKVLEGISQCLLPEGFLFLGGAETILGITDRFTKFDEDIAGIYRKRT